MKKKQYLYYRDWTDFVLHAAVVDLCKVLARMVVDGDSAECRGIVKTIQKYHYEIVSRRNNPLEVSK